MSSIRYGKNGILGNPKSTAVKHMPVLGLTDRSTRRTLKRINFHVYKMTITQKLNVQDKINRPAF